MMVVGRGFGETTAIHLLKTCCLPTLIYASESSSLSESDKHEISVIWNNCFQHLISLLLAWNC